MDSPESALIGIFSSFMLKTGFLLGACEIMARLHARWARWFPAAEPLLRLVPACAGAGLFSLLGFHAALGGFAMGVLMRRHVRQVSLKNQPLRAACTAVLAPVFLLDVGMQLDLATLTGWTVASILPPVLVAALGAKVFGTLAGGWVAKLPPRAALTAGICLSARGMLGVVLAQIGRERGLYTALVFDLAVAVDVLSTLCVPPLLWAAGWRTAEIDLRDRLPRQEVGLDDGIRRV